MKKAVLILLILAYSVLSSQTHRFIYELKYKVADETVKTNMVLDIDKDFVKFYDYDFLANDSIRKKTGENVQTNSNSDQLIIRKRNSNENKAFHDNFFDYFVVTSVDKINWKISKEIKKVESYTLQKATSNFGGRNWTTWFSTEIPFQEGPYKFRDLPGLIFEVYDDGDNFCYSLVKSQNLPQTFETKDFLETHFGNNPITVTLQQYNKVKLNYYNDPVAESSKLLKEGGTVIMNGEKIDRPEQLDQKRKILQQMIIKYYNPLELDKAIPYPKS